jgi:hypothetical protein
MGTSGKLKIWKSEVMIAHPGIQPGRFSEFQDFAHPTGFGT